MKLKLAFKKVANDTCGCLLSRSPVDIATARQERVVAPTTSRSTRLSYGYDPESKFPFAYKMHAKSQSEVIPLYYCVPK